MFTVISTRIIKLVKSILNFTFSCFVFVIGFITSHFNTIFDYIFSCVTSISTYLIVFVLTVSLLIGRFLGSVDAFSLKSPKTDSVDIVIDAGHGGMDPGKVGINNALEKHINLAIALKLKEYFNNSNYSVILTRTDDNDLSDPDTTNHKTQDLNNRIKIINNSTPKCVISIHQNSFSDTSPYGPSIYYYKLSDEGKLLAETVQNTLEENLSCNASRPAIPNDNYYLLKHSAFPMIIVECGFLSNPTEANLLIQDEYQDKVAKLIFRGVCNYLNSKK